MKLRPCQQPQSVALTIAGSDSGGNAGIQADLRTFHGFDVHGCTAITALTAQNPNGVAGVLAVEPAFLQQQVEAIFAAYEVRAIKTGMLANAALIETVADCLSHHRNIPLVVDPVMVATSGASLVAADALAAFTRRLLPMASLITPNLPEAAALLGHPVAGVEAAAAAAVELAARFRCAVLVKGGHASPAHQASDFLCTGGAHLFRLRTPVVRDPLSRHGTGCTLSAAITAALASGCSLQDAVVAGKAYVYDALCHGRTLGPRATVLGMVKRRKPATVKIEDWATAQARE
ncbi:MAG: bifunctional hydroxymethylpyrimidine kinase/phosphomethylpyrimidine kinase [bacterium]